MLEVTDAARAARAAPVATRVVRSSTFPELLWPGSRYLAGSLGFSRLRHCRPYLVQSHDVMFCHCFCEFPTLFARFRQGSHSACPFAINRIAPADILPLFHKISCSLLHCPSDSLSTSVRVSFSLSLSFYLYLSVFLHAEFRSRMVHFFPKTPLI